AVSTISAVVSGIVNAHGSDTLVAIEYGSDPNNLQMSILGTPAIATGYADTWVGAVLNNLAQGTTYYYRLKGTSAGGIGISNMASFKLDVLSGFDQQFPGTAPDAQGFILVNLSPAGIGVGWRFVGEQQWRPSGVPVGG